MEYPNNSSPDQEPNSEELRQLLDISYDLIGKIIKEHGNKKSAYSATVIASTPESLANDRQTYLAVKNIDENEHEVIITETDYSTGYAIAVEQYTIAYVYGGGEIELLATDTQDEPRPASADEIRRLANILEIGAYGETATFDFDEFEKQFKEHLDKK